MLAPLVVLSFAVGSVLLTHIGWIAWRPVRDSAWMNAIGVLVAIVVLRVGSIRARALPDVLEVRNIGRTRRYAWAQILAVDFRPELGAPWAQLDLSDGTTATVMAVQASDGEAGARAAERLRILVDERGTAAFGDGS